ncbi:MAG: hypothetical protein HUJ26_23010 [Planctomycetaceae bacterium]|nr:hypothetical protein [Planctomycetaceae bacterium]
MIVQAPAAWKQNIQSLLSACVESVLWKEPNASHMAPRQNHVQAEETLSFATRAADDSNTIGLGLVLEENSSLMLGIHHPDRTELHVWKPGSTTDALELLKFLLEQLDRRQFRFEATTSRQIGATDLFENSEQSCGLWRFEKSQTFHPLAQPDAGGLLCGSFNPLHRGHQCMRQAAEEILEQPVAYEMTLLNADKPPLDFLSLAARAKQFHAGELFLTTAPTFTEKAELLPGRTFVIGWDTAIRVLDRRFYPDGQLESALERLAERECRFLVAARRQAGALQRLGDLEIPEKFRDLFLEIPPELFEEDVSSTAIREAWLRGDSELGPPLHTLLDIPHND